MTWEPREGNSRGKKKKPKGLLKNQFITQLKLRDVLWGRKKALKAFSLPNFKSDFMQLLELIPKKKTILGNHPQRGGLGGQMAPAETP